ncbi:MAG: [protein-PII] uridylyltransferase [Planctomycetaceae bacterium]
MAAILDRTRVMFAEGVPAIDITTARCKAIVAVVCEFMEEAIAPFSDDVVSELRKGTAIVAVGGTGRGELCPASDVDLLFLDGGTASAPFRDAVSRCVQALYDARLQVGQSLRTIAECVTLAREEPEVATSLVEARHLWGSEKLVDQLQRSFAKTVVKKRQRAFILDCLTARVEEGPQSQELEPDVKNSRGGLRDLHLLRWLGFALTGRPELESLLKANLLTAEEVQTLRDAREFLTRIRIDLHLRADREQDRLTRDEQLRITRDRGIEESPTQRAVERLMQEYFQHSTNISRITRRFANRHRPRSMGRAARNLLVGHRADRYLRVHPDEVDTPARHLSKVCSSVESILRMYRLAALSDLAPSPRLMEGVSDAVPRLPADVSRESAQLFMDILGCPNSLPAILREMADNRLLDLLIPDFTHARCLMQFNQYHHYTVDEHTLRTIEVVTSYEQEDSPVGAAYRALKHKELVHLALILHDLGKGMKERHSIIGERIAERIGPRLGLQPKHVEQVMFLVRQHLEMADIAFRRDTADPDLLVKFSHQVGSPELLRMLFVLTAADVTGVGPGVWTDWKAELLSDLFNRCMLILSGKHYSYFEQERMQEVKRKVASIIVPIDSAYPEAERQSWIEKQLAGVSAYYLTCTSPEQIASDLDVIQRIDDQEIHVSGLNEEATQTVEYRIITRSKVATDGCFHRICGVLAAKRLEIIAADINTTDEGTIIDRFRVLDSDFSGNSPKERIDEVAQVLTKVLRGDETVDAVFHRNKRFGANRSQPTVSNLPARVVIDNASSDSRTIIDVFAHDCPGLLFRVSRVLYELDLSIDLAKISTHFDQVVDVFYVTERDDSKVLDGPRTDEIRQRLTALLEELSTPPS